MSFSDYLANEDEYTKLQAEQKSAVQEFYANIHREVKATVRVERLEKEIQTLRFKHLLMVILNIFLATMLVCVGIATRANAQSATATGDLQVTGRATKLPADIDFYMDGILIDRLTLTQREFLYRHAPFGKGQHTLKVVERSGTGPITLLTKVYSGSCNVYSLTEDAAKYFWCRDVSDYWKTRQTKARHLLFPAIKLVVNNSLGGTITELYGADRSYNLISEHGGAAMQLSLWGIPPGDINAYGYPCQPEGSTNWEGMHKILNPIQASTKNCWYEDIKATYGDEGLTNDVSSQASCGSKCWLTTKNQPFNFTRSKALPGMRWSQRTEVFAEGYAKIGYTVNYTGVPLQYHPQEVPGMFWSMGGNPKIHWFGYKEPYQATPTYWSETLNGQLVSLSNALYAYSPVTRVMAVPWWSMCNAAETRCVTLVYPNQPNMQQVNFEVGETGSWYASAMHYFSLATGFQGTYTIYVFPVKYTQIDSGLLSNIINNG